MTSPPQEPGGWELKRSVDGLRSDVNGLGTRIEARLDRLVTQDAFAAEQRRVDDKFKDLAEDIAAEREARKEAVAHVQVLLDKMTGTQRWLVAAILLPIALFVATIVLASRGQG